MSHFICGIRYAAYRMSVVNDIVTEALNTDRSYYGLLLSPTIILMRAKQINHLIIVNVSFYQVKEGTFGFFFS